MNVWDAVAAHFCFQANIAPRQILLDALAVGSSPKRSVRQLVFCVLCACICSSVYTDSEFRTPGRIDQAQLGWHHEVSGRNLIATRQTFLGQQLHRP